MRPNSVIWFERLFLATLAIGVLQSAYGWNAAVAASSVALVLTVMIVTFALILGLVFLVSRKRSRIALAVLVLLFAIGLPGFYKIITSGPFFGVESVALLQTVMELVALVFIFTPESRAWMRR